MRGGCGCRGPVSRMEGMRVVGMEMKKKGRRTRYSLRAG